MNKHEKSEIAHQSFSKKGRRVKKSNFFTGSTKGFIFQFKKPPPLPFESWNFSSYTYTFTVSLFFLLSLKTRKRSWKCQKLLHLPTRAPQILSFLQSRTPHILSLLSSLSKILLPWILALVQLSITSEEYPLMVDATYSTISTVISSKFLESMSLRFVQ